MKPRLTLFIGVLAVSSASILIRLSEAPPLVISTYRLGIAALIMSILALREMGDLLLLKGRDLAIYFLSGFFLSLHFAAWITSLSYTTIASSVILVDSSPIFVALLSHSLLKERVGRRGMIGILLAFSGAIGIASSHLPFQVNIYGDSLAILGAIAMALYLIIGRDLRRKLGTLSYVSGVYSIAFLFLLLSTLIAEDPLTGYRMEDYILFFALALGPSSIGHTLYNYCLGFLKAHVVSISILGEVLVATILGSLIFSETPNLWLCLGGIMILTGIYLVLWE